MTNLSISTKGVDLIKGFEGFVDHAYKPVAEEKYYTIGYGHYGADVSSNATITEADAVKLLAKDLESYVMDVNLFVTAPVNQNQFDALTSFCYNVGAGNLKSSTLLQLVNEQRFGEASQEFGKWVHGANHQVLGGLVKRRQAEAQLFNTPMVANVHPSAETYTVQSGDNLTHIANHFGVSIDFLMKLNGISNSNLIRIGEVLKVKEVAPVAPPKPVAPPVTHSPAPAVVRGLPLSVGSKGDLVKNVQRFLGLTADGDFGPNTKSAVERYQKMRGLAVDGVVGQVTYHNMFPQA